MRYTVTLTELDDVSGNPDAKVVRVTPHTGEAFEVLGPAVDVRNDPREIDAEIHRETDGATVSFGELVEDARLSAITPQARELWVDAMVTLIHGWVYPWDDGCPISPPPDGYWEQAGQWWADLVTVPPPEDLIAALREYREELGGRNFGGYQTFVDVARRLTATTSAVCRASAVLQAPGTTLGIQPLGLAVLSARLPHESLRQGLGRGR